MRFPVLLIGLLAVCSACVSVPSEDKALVGEAAESSWAETLEGSFFKRRPAWRRWGHQHLQTGDLVFTRGNHYILLGTVNFTDVATTISASEFSHVGLVAIEDGEPFVYDVSEQGVAKLPFDRYVTQFGSERVTVRRPREQLYASLPKVLEFIRSEAATDKPFDHHFSDGTDAYYCTELVVHAFRSAGHEVCAASRIGDLPGRHRANAVTTRIVQSLTGLNDDSRIYCIGNGEYGLMASPQFTELLPPTPVKTFDYTATSLR